jgi:hypothetical protein
VSGLGSNVATFLATPSSANLASAVTDETGSGALVFATSPALVTPTVSRIVEAAAGEGIEIEGVTDGSAPTAGYVGEVISSSVGRGSGTSLTTGVTVTITSIELTAGDWDLRGVIGYDGGSGVVVTALDFAVSLTAATLPSTARISSPSGGEVYYEIGKGGNGIGDWDMSHGIASYQVSISSTDTFYLVAASTFASGTLAAYGHIEARRMR